MENLNIVVDVGGSETKVIYNFNNERTVNYFSIAPEIKRVTISDFKDYLKQVSKKQQLFGFSGVVNPLKQLYIVEKNSDSVIAVGDLAVTLEASNNLMQPKYENAVYKIMAVLAFVLEQKYSEINCGLSINLGTLLPSDEIGDQLRFKNFLLEKLKSYTFRKKDLVINLNNLICKAEGAGLVLARCKLKGQNYFTQSKIGILMLGHRNVTSLYFVHGELKQATSPLLGFAFMISEIKKTTFGLDEASIIEKIYQAWQQKSPYGESFYSNNDETLPNFIRQKSNDNLYYPEWQRVYCLRDLAKAENDDLRQLEAKDLGKTFEKAQKKYIDNIFSWLKKDLPPCDEVIISGGTAIFLKPFLEFYFNYPMEDSSARQSSYGYKTFRKGKATPIIWDANIRKTIGSILNIRNELDLIRAEDAFGLYGYLTSLKPSP